MAQKLAKLLHQLQCSISATIIVALRKGGKGDLGDICRVYQHATGLHRWLLVLSNWYNVSTFSSVAVVVVVAHLMSELSMGLVARWWCPMSKGGRREGWFICTSTCSNATSKHSHTHSHCHCICNWHRSDRGEGHHYNCRSEASLASHNRHINLGICENCWPLNGSGIWIIASPPPFFIYRICHPLPK